MGQLYLLRRALDGRRVVIKVQPYTNDIYKLLPELRGDPVPPANLNERYACSYGEFERVDATHLRCVRLSDFWKSPARNRDGRFAEGVVYEMRAMDDGDFHFAEPHLPWWSFRPDGDIWVH